MMNIYMFHYVLFFVVARSFAWQLLSNWALGNVCRNAAKYEIQLVLTTLEKDEEEQEEEEEEFELRSSFYTLQEGIFILARCWQVIFGDIYDPIKYIYS